MLLLLLGWLLGLALVLIGLAGTVLPGLPGVPLLFLGLIVIAAVDGFQRVGLLTIALLGALTVLSVALDFLATSEGARRFGAGRTAILCAMLGLLVGLFFGLPGILLGPFIGAAAGHFLARGGIEDAFRAGAGASLGMLVGTATKVLLAFGMLLWFTVAWWV